MIKNYLLLLILTLSCSVSAQIITIPDANFKAKLLEADTTNEIAVAYSGGYTKIDSNGDGEIQESEALQIKSLSISKSNISSLEGIKYFSNLESLFCDENQLTTLDVSKLSKLKQLYLSQNQIATLNLKGLVYLSELNCDFNLLPELDLKECRNLTSLSFANNKLTSIDVSILSELRSLNCDSNPLTNLDLNGLTSLYSLSCAKIGLATLDLKGLINLASLACEDNNLTSLDVKEAINLDWLDCSNNKLKTLDLSATKKIETLACGGNELTTINLENLSNLGYFAINGSPLLESIFAKNGSPQFFGFSSNPSPNLKYVCVDDNLVARVQAAQIKNGNTTCVVSSYCSFVPGGPLYSIQGKIRLDKDNNGCDSSDINASNIKFNISDGTTNGNVITDESGNYSIAVSTGSYTITPTLENPAYFAISPPSIKTNSTATGQFAQNFCLSSNGDHQDLEITLLSIIPARPGFDATYKLVYKNKGTQIKSGSVSLDFNDAVLDLVSATPLVTSQVTNKLSWDYENLQPFETREITIVLNVNSPMETPAVNINDRLSFNALILPVIDDEKPVDNSFALRQIVVGSYDPNDKTCLEGDVIKSELIGEYVHYLIRFENTGTYPAENIVVKDMIDLSKFDISTLVPTGSSHSYITKISGGNKVEFIFEKINLPFDNAHNDGYIAFKIKTLPTLSVGDSFENEANIYFDYNFPILTNKATSTFKTLGTKDFEFSNYFNVYPNPVHDILNISAKNDIEIESMSIYDILGQLVIAAPNAKNISNIDVSKLTIGNYILKVKSNKGSSVMKFIKK